MMETDEVLSSGYSTPPVHEVRKTSIEKPAIRNIDFFFMVENLEVFLWL
jgi:hypothetical protein